MIRPIHESDHVVGPDGTLSLRALTPGAHVRVIVVETGQERSEWGAGPIPGTRVYLPDKPRLAWGSMSGTVLRYDQPFEPACDPDEWESAG